MAINEYFTGSGKFVDIISNLEANNRQVREAEFAAAKSRLDAAYNRFSAADALALGRADTKIRNLKTGGEIGRVRAGFASSGVDANVGTPLALAADARAFGDYEAARIRHGAETKAWGDEYAAHLSDLAADFSTAKARSLRKTGILDATGSVLKLAGGFTF